MRLGGICCWLFAGCLLLPAACFGQPSATEPAEPAAAAEPETPPEADPETPEATADESPATDDAPAADEPTTEEPAAEDAEEKTPSPAAAGALADFKQQFEEWKKLLARLKELQLQYKFVKPEERPAVEAEYNELLGQGEKQAAVIIQAAEASYTADPKGDAEVTNFLISIAYNDLRNDKYEEAFRLSKMLTDTKAPNPQAAEWAGVAAFALNDFDAAEKYLTLAKENKSIDQEGESFLGLIPEYRELWAKEQVTREAEAKADDLPRVLLKTTRGDIVIELFENEAPNTVANFVDLVDKKFYDGLSFHRVLHGFMAQGGDPKGNGSGGPGYHIPCECFSENHRNHFAGTLSMAHAGKDTGGSQFFLTFRPTSHLNGKHTVFGRVIEGFDVLAKLKQRNPEQPGVENIAPDKILSATVLRKRDHEYKPETLPEK